MLHLQDANFTQRDSGIFSGPNSNSQEPDQTACFRPAQNHHSFINSQGTINISLLVWEVEGGLSERGFHRLSCETLLAGRRGGSTEPVCLSMKGEITNGGRQGG